MPTFEFTRRAAIALGASFDSLRAASLESVARPAHTMRPSRFPRGLRSFPRGLRSERLPCRPSIPATQRSIPDTTEL